MPIAIGKLVNASKRPFIGRFLFMMTRSIRGLSLILARTCMEYLLRARNFGLYPIEAIPIEYSRLLVSLHLIVFYWFKNNLPSAIPLQSFFTSDSSIRLE